MIRGVLFDMDGVIIDSEILSRKQLVEIVAGYGYTMDLALHDSLLGYNYDEAGKILRRCYGEQFPWESIRDDFISLTCKSMKEGLIPLKPFADECVFGLKKLGIMTALATSNNRSAIELYKNRYRVFREGFDAIVCGDEVTHSKPHPEIYLTAAAKLGLDPKECMGVEDSLLGLQSIRAAGIESVMVPDLIPYDEKAAPFVRYKLSSLSGLCSLVERLNLNGKLRC